MKDVIAWGGALAALAVLLVLLLVNTSSAPALAVSVTTLDASSFAVYAVDASTADHETAEPRNPFRYAPVSEEGEFDQPISAEHQASMNFPMLAVEGVLLRRSGKQAFVRYESHRRAVAEGEEIVDGFTVAAIDEESVVVSNLWGKSRRYYVMP